MSREKNLSSTAKKADPGSIASRRLKSGSCPWCRDPNNFGYSSIANLRATALSLGSFSAIINHESPAGKSAGDPGEVILDPKAQQVDNLLEGRF
jgi:hypothetical protein